MKRSFNRLFAIASVAILTTACYKGGSDGDEYSGALFGVWILDTKTETFEASGGGNTSTRKTVEDFSLEACSLELDPELTALIKFGTKRIEIPYSFDAESKRIEFLRGLSFFDNGKEFALKGSYDVIIQDNGLMSFAQQDFGVNDGSITADKTTVYVFHRKTEESNDKQERPY